MAWFKMKKKIVGDEIRTHPLDNFINNAGHRREFKRLFFDYDEIYKLVKDISFWIAIPFAITVFLDYPIDKYKSLLVFAATVLALIVRVIFIDDVIRRANVITQSSNCNIYVLKPNNFEIVFHTPMRCIPSVAHDGSRLGSFTIKNLTETGFEIQYNDNSEILGVRDLKFKAIALP